MKKILLRISLLGCLAVLAGCGEEQNAVAKVEKTMLSPQHISQDERWYSRQQVNRGNVLFQTQCAVCHQPDASGTPDWKKLNADGKLPPPPLNGTAHTWHHPLSVLRRTVKIGGVPLGGSMPGFAGKLTDREIDDILAWVQSHWPSEIYAAWARRNSKASQYKPIKKN